MNETKLEYCQRMTEHIIQSYPSHLRIDNNPTYFRVLRENLMALDDDAIDALANPLTGIVSVCKFIPSMVEVQAFIKNYKYLERCRIAEANPPPPTLPEPEETEEEKAIMKQKWKELQKTMKQSIKPV